MNQLVPITADGQVGPAGIAVTVLSVVLTGTGAAATLSLHNGTAATDLVVTFKAASDTTVSHTFSGGGVFPGGCYADITGANASACIEIA